MGPIDVITSFGKVWGYLIFLLIGIGFGMVLEMSGFGNSKKLAAQFYFREMTVLKVMFTAIIVAMVLISGFSSFGLMDFDKVFVNPTYLFPGILGGLIMGFGFIIGGFCPGTSIVAASTLKIDGFFFAGGVFFGVFTFGETVSSFQNFYNSSYLERFTLPELFGMSTGTVVVLVVLMALTMFYWAEISERYFGAQKAWKTINKIPTDIKKVTASAIFVFISLLVLFAGQPNAKNKWDNINENEMKKLINREVYIHPYELLEVINDPMLYLKVFDFRSETDFNLFHLENARKSDIAEINNNKFIKELKAYPENTVVIVMSNGERIATNVYKLLKGQGVLNLYILEGGINNWLSHFPLDRSIAEKTSVREKETLNYVFNFAVGEKEDSSHPGEIFLKKIKKLVYEKKIKIKKKKVISGGCG